MGCESSRLRLDSSLLEKVINATHYNKQELRELHKAFLTVAPGGVLTEAAFVKAYAMYFPIAVDATAFASHIFRSFDGRSLGRMEFSDYARALSVMQRGCTDEKVDWLFRVFDVNGDGEIAEEEMREIFRALDQLVGKERSSSRRSSSASSPSSPLPGRRSSGSLSTSRMSICAHQFQLQQQEEALAERTKAVFADMDLNEDGRIDRQEFSKTVRLDAQIREFLEGE